MYSQPSLVLTLAALGSACGLLCATHANAENAVVLESFEDSISSASLLNWGGRGANNHVAFSQYSKVDASDINVTEGEKSLEVDLTVEEFFGWDFQLTLSEDASALVRQAAGSGQQARYILRYDVVFPKIGAGGVANWMNSAINFGSFANQLEAAGGKRTMSVPLDITTGIPASGPVVLHLADNFDAIEDPFEGPITIYVDNIRLVDTYAPGATATIIPLQSFEQDIGGAAVFTGWGGTARSSFSQYEGSGPDDPFVTDGNNSLKVDYTGSGGWNADFVIPFNNTPLADILGLDLPADQRPTAAQLARYTLRFDVIFPAKGPDWSGDWMNLSPHTQVQDLSYTLGRSGSTASPNRQTYSVTLDTVAWADWTTPKPELMFILNGAWGASGTTIYFDNFRLIDTGSTTPEGLRITGFQFNNELNQVTLTWNSTAGKNYTILFTSNLPTFNEELASDIPAAGASTTYTAELPEVSNRHFFWIRENP